MTTDTEETNGWKIMNKDGAATIYLKILLFFIGVQTAILSAGVPWAFVIGGRVSSMETHMQVMAVAVEKTAERYFDLIDRNTELLERIIKIESAVSNLHPRP